MRNHSAEKAFTLVEALLAAAVGIVICGVIFLMTLTSQKMYVSMDTSIQVQEQVWRAFDQMTRELAGASNVTTLSTTCTDCALDFQLPIGYDPGPPAGPILGAVDQNQQNRPGWHVQYRLKVLSATQRQLIRILRNGNPATGADVGTERILANSVDPLLDRLFSVTNNPNAGNSVRIRLQITTLLNTILPGGNRTSGVLRTQVELRNS